jgi:hypothetical protein
LQGCNGFSYSTVRFASQHVVLARVLEIEIESK